MLNWSIKQAECTVRKGSVYLCSHPMHICGLSGSPGGREELERRVWMEWAVMYRLMSCWGSWMWIHCIAHSAVHCNQSVWWKSMNSQWGVWFFIICIDWGINSIWLQKHWIIGRLGILSNIFSSPSCLLWRCPFHLQKVWILKKPKQHVHGTDSYGTPCRDGARLTKCNFWITAKHF